VTEYERVSVVADVEQDELLKLQWRDIDSALQLKIRPITAIVLREIRDRLNDGSLYDDRPVKWVKTGPGGRNRISGVE